jgi:heme-degrading monooxygenase HmoA
MEKQVVLIDVFTVPESALPEFLEAAGKLPPLLRTLPGYVEGWLYQVNDGPTPYNVVTTAVWENREAFENAAERAQAEYKRIGFNPHEVVSRLNVKMERGIYERTPY